MFGNLLINTLGCIPQQLISHKANASPDNVRSIVRLFQIIGYSYQVCNGSFIIPPF